MILSPKISTFIVFAGLLIFYYRSVTTTILSLTLVPRHADIIDTTPRQKADGAREKFESAWEAIRSELLAHFEGQSMPNEAREWYKRVSGAGVLVCLY
jgi:hypothetical protein